MSDRTYYAKGTSIYRSPVERVQENGMRAVSMGFRVCEMADGMEDQADSLAMIMNLGDAAPQFVEAIKTIRTEGTITIDAETQDHVIRVPATTMDRIASALEKAAAA